MDPEQFIFMISLPVDEPQAASDALASAVGIITATQRDEHDDNVDTPTQVLMVAIGRAMRMALGRHLISHARFLQCYTRANGGLITCRAIKAEVVHYG
jgi:hypothetical protein